jgi:hypothetical protein
MATATATQQRAVKVAAGRVVSAKPRLLMIIGGVEYQAALFEDDHDDKSINDSVHMLRTSRGAWFEVFPRWGMDVPDSDPNWCERCNAAHCPHVEALVEFNLLCPGRQL